MFKVLGKIKFEDIEVGKVFGLDGCFEIYYKYSKNSVLFLTTDIQDIQDESWSSWNTIPPIDPGDIWIVDFAPFFMKRWRDDLYELPENVQNLFITK